MRPIRELTDAAFAELSPQFDRLYSRIGRPSIPPEQLLRASLVQTKRQYTAIDARTTRHPGYHRSQRKRKLVEQTFGWMKTVGLMRKLRHRGGELVDWMVPFTATAYNLVRVRTLGATSW